MGRSRYPQCSCCKFWINLTNKKYHHSLQLNFSLSFFTWEFYWNIVNKSISSIVVRRLCHTLQCFLLTMVMMVNRTPWWMANGPSEFETEWPSTLMSPHLIICDWVMFTSLIIMSEVQTCHSLWSTLIFFYQKRNIARCKIKILDDKCTLILGNKFQISQNYS